MRILRIGLIMVAASLAGLQVSAEETKPFAAADQTETASAEPQADCLEEKSGDLIYCAQADDEILELESTL